MKHARHLIASWTQLFVHLFNSFQGARILRCKIYRQKSRYKGKKTGKIMSLELLECSLAHSRPPHHGVPVHAYIHAHTIGSLLPLSHEFVAQPSSCGSWTHSTLHQTMLPEFPVVANILKDLFLNAAGVSKQKGST